MKKSMSFVLLGNSKEDIEEVIKGAKNYLRTNISNFGNIITLRLIDKLSFSKDDGCIYYFEAEYTIKERVNIALSMLDWSSEDSVNELHALEVCERLLDMHDVEYEEFKVETLRRDINVVTLSYMEVHNNEND